MVICYCICQNEPTNICFKCIKVCIFKLDDLKVRNFAARNFLYIYYDFCSGIKIAMGTYNLNYKLLLLYKLLSKNY